MNYSTQLLEKATLTVSSELPFPFEKEPILSESDKAWLEQEETWLESLENQHLAYSDIDLHY
jgi:hypothetical protein